MKNLEQIRSLHAFRFWNTMWLNENDAKKRLKNVTGKEGGDVLSKLGPLILSSGLLGTAAFAKDKGGGHETLLREIGRYLSSDGDDGRRFLPTEADFWDETGSKRPPPHVGGYDAGVFKQALNVNVRINKESSCLMPIIGQRRRQDRNG